MDSFFTYYVAHLLHDHSRHAYNEIVDAFCSYLRERVYALGGDCGVMEVKIHAEENYMEIHNEEKKIVYPLCYSYHEAFRGLKDSSIVSDAFMKFMEGCMTGGEYSSLIWLKGTLDDDILSLRKSK